MLKKTLLDRAIGYVAPEAGMRRSRARLQQAQLDKIQLRHFEGASKGRRTDGWLAPATSANAANGPALDKLRFRSRDLVRNNTHAERAVRVIQTNVVGTGILAHPKSRNKRVEADLKFIWKEWADSTDCDADGVNDFYGLQSLVMRELVESGEVLIRRRRRFSTDKLAVPLQLQVLEADFLDTRRDGVQTNGSVVVQGVQFNRLGQREGYWLFSQHPGENILLSRGASTDSKFIPAEDIIHIHRVDRAGQVRGIPWGAVCIIKLRDFDELEDANLLRKKIASFFAGFVQDMEAPLDSEQAKEELPENIESGAIEYLPRGKTITFPNVPNASDEGHAVRVIRSIGIGYGISYEALSGDYSNVNFSSARMGWIEFQRNLDVWQWQLMIPRFCVPAWRWFREAAFLAGYKSIDATAAWTPPRREMIDPTKEVPAQRDAIRAGLKTLSQAIREQGYEPEEMLVELKTDAATLDRLGLKLDSDPRYLSRGGNTQMEATASGGSSEESDQPDSEQQSDSEAKSDE